MIMNSTELLFNESIEEKIRPIVLALRLAGLNTFCSCGHGMWVQIESYDSENELKIIAAVMSELKILKFRVHIFEEYTPISRHRAMELSIPNDAGVYYCKTVDDLDYNK